ncbi:hypothetical protein OCL88_08140 [Paenarthrobacter sp. PAE-2]|uniref:hypothetical protein n=1 Tax=Paenarthrobacter sp. PAE-2 TaxID=2982532 RepID=UPI00223274BB|nr:hypothetical protein [Paenarthrobacter sp. PAE-2]MCW3766441.1 hypothetical protein [Paenarthrobacter sp. PAE-2]
MTKTRKKSFAVVHPIGHRPFHDTCELYYRSSAEFKQQMTAYARRKWPLPQVIEIDMSTNTIVVNGIDRGKFSEHEHRESAQRAIQTGLDL